MRKKKVLPPVLKIKISNGSEITFTSEKKCIDYIKSLRREHYKQEDLYFQKFASCQYKKMLDPTEVVEEPIRPEKLVITFIPLK